MSPAEHPKTRFYDHFGIENIPFGIAHCASHPKPAVVTRYYDSVFFLDALAEAGYLTIGEATRDTFRETTLNSFAALPKSEHSLVRKAIQDLLRKHPGFDDSKSSCHINVAEMHLPFSIGDFTDFSCSENHVLNASEVIFKKREAPPGFYHFPVGYTARTSSIVVSGTPVKRPRGQYKNGDGQITFGPTNRLDYELEIGAFIGRGSVLGKPINLHDAEDHIFGLVLLNDWSARDIQALEMNPLGPLNGKSFCTTISPWVITLESLAPFRAPLPDRNPDVELPGYLHSVSEDAKIATYDLELSAEFKRSNGRSASRVDGTTICQTKFSSLYWTLSDLVAHQTINGCNLNVGDLLATGTISGQLFNSRGCLMERPDGVECGTDSIGNPVLVRTLGDGDTLLMTGKAGEGVGFGECIGTILEAIVDTK